VVIDPYPSATAAMAAMRRKDGVYLLPAATQFETEGLVHRVEPLDPVARKGDRAAVRVEARPHHHVSVRAEARLRRTVREELKVKDRTTRADMPDVLREINRGTGPSATPASRRSG
jgi:formate dehydrogenase major subunit